MITKAIVTEVIDIYKARVRIPIYNQIEGAATATPNDQLYIARINTALGVRPALKVGDVVFVGFEDNRLQQPIILGALAREDDQTSSNIQAQTLEVNVMAQLPKDTTIGDVDGHTIEHVLKTFRELENIVANTDESAKLNTDKLKQLEELVTKLEEEIAMIQLKQQEQDARIVDIEEQLTNAVNKGCNYLKKEV